MSVPLKPQQANVTVSKVIVIFMCMVLMFLSKNVNKSGIFLKILRKRNVGPITSF